MMSIEKIILPVGDWLGFVLIWKKKRRDQVENNWWQEQPDKKQKCPVLIRTPPISDPPNNCHGEQQVQHPERVHPVDAFAFSRLHKIAESADNARHAQSEHDRSKDNKIAEWIHASGLSNRRGRCRSIRACLRQALRYEEQTRCAIALASCSSDAAR